MQFCAVISKFHDFLKSMFERAIELPPSETETFFL